MIVEGSNATRGAGKSAVPVPPAFKRVDDVIGALAELENALVASKDQRGIFVTAYLGLTRVIQEWIDRGLFLENEIVARYVVEFANTYRQALADYEQGSRLAIPKAWQQSFDTCRDKNASILQYLLLGVNAHINYDLPHAVLQAGLNVNCDRCYHDHTRINDAVDLAIPLIRHRVATLYQHSLRITNCIYGRAIDAAVALSFQRARQNSWMWARALHSAQSVAERTQVDKLLNERAAMAGQMILAHDNAPAKCVAVLYEVEDLIPCPRQAETN